MTVARFEPKTLTRRRCASIARLALRAPAACNRQALLIGTSGHRCRPFSHLAPPALGLQGLHAALTAPELGGFEAPSPLCDQPAFHLNMELESFFRDREPDTLLLLYVSGYAIVDECGGLALITHGTDRGRWRASVVDFGFLRDVMDQCASEQQVLILDCIFGSLADAAPAIGASLDLEAALGGPRRAVLAASNGVRFALRDDGVLGDTRATPLVEHIVHGLRTGEADLDADGLVSLDDLAGYARGRAGPDMALEPSSSRELGPVVIARRAPSARSEPAPAPLPANQRGAAAAAASTARPPRRSWASHAASSVASWLAQHVGL